MIFSIQGKLGFADIFGGKIATKINFQLDLSGNYYLIYANLSNDDTSGLDVFKTLNEAYGLSLPEKCFYVAEAGFFTFSSKNDGKQSLADIFPNAPLPCLIKKNATPIKKTACFWLTIDIHKFDLFSTLPQIGCKDITTLSLVGQFITGTEAGTAINTTRYSISLTNFKLFNLFEFEELIFHFVFGKASEYKIHGTIKFSIFNKPYTFKGTVNSNEKRLKAGMKIESGGDIENPFDGKMKGVTLNKLSFGINYTYKTESKPAHGIYGIKGTVNYGDKKLFTGLLYLEDSTPVLACVLIEKDINVDVLFNKSIPTAKWPDKLINIIFYKGSELYYLKKDKPQKNIGSFDESCNASDEVAILSQNVIEYQPGFHIYAKLKLTLCAPIDVIGNIKITEDGIEAGIQLEKSISIYVLKICKYGGGNSGPKLTIISAKEQMRFECSLLFFNECFGTKLFIDAKKDDKGELEISGKLKSTKSYSILPNNTSLDFNYSDNQGFRITNWPTFDIDENLIDFIKIMKKIANSKTSACGELANFINETVLTTKFKVKLSCEVVNQKFYLVVNGDYILYASKHEILKAKFPGLIKIHVSNSAYFHDLPKAINEGIQNATPRFVENLLTNPKAISIFLVTMSGKKAAEYALSLICKGLSGSGVAAAAAAGWDALLAFGGSLSGAAIAAAIGAITKSVDDSGGGDPSGDKKPKSPKDITLTYNSPNKTLDVQWFAKGGATGYQLEFLDSNEKEICRDKFSYKTTRTTLVIPEVKSGYYKAKITSTKGNFVSSPPTVKTILCLSSPHLSIDLDYHNIKEHPALLLKWNQIPSCTGYNVKMNYELCEEKIDTLEKKIIFTKQYEAGDYSLSIQATGNQNYINSPFSKTEVWTRLNRPQHVQASYEQPKISVSWNAIEKSDQFKIRMVNEASQEVKIYKAIGTELVVDNPFTFENDLHLIITIISLPKSYDSKQIPSLWSKSVTIDIRLTPKQIAAKYYKMGSGENGEACVKAIQQAYPDIALVEIAKAMESVQYKAEQTAIGLYAISLNISATVLTAILKEVYTTIKKVPISNILKTLNYNQKQIAKALKRNWTNITAIRVAGILLNAAIYPRTTHEEMKEALLFAGFKPLEVSDALNKYYPPSAPSKICIFSLIDIDGIIKKYAKELVAFYGYDPTIESPDDDLKQRLLAIGIGDGLFEINDSHEITPYIKMISNGKPQFGYELTPNDTKIIDGKEYLTSTFNLAIQARENDQLFWYSEIINTSSYIKTTIGTVSNLVDGNNPQKATCLKDLEGFNKAFHYAGKKAMDKDYDVFQKTKKTHEYKGKIASKINDSRFEYLLSIWVLSDAFDYAGKKVSVPIMQLNVKPNIRLI